MQVGHSKIISPATAQEIESLRQRANGELSVPLNLRLPSELLLPPRERNALFDALKQRSISVVEIIPGKVDLGFLARSAEPFHKGCSIPSGVEAFVGQRFTFHACSALAFNLRYGVSVRTPNSMRHQDTRSNDFYMAKELRSKGGDDITMYARPICPILEHSGVPITQKMRELDRIEVVLAIDLRGYGALTNRLDSNFVAGDSDNFWAVCAPPKEHMHILGVT